MLWENRLSFHNLLSISGGKKVENYWENLSKLNISYLFLLFYFISLAALGGCGFAAIVRSAASVSLNNQLSSSDVSATAFRWMQCA